MVKPSALAVARLSTCSNLAARRSGSVAAEWRFGTEPAEQVRRDLGNAAHAEQCHIAIHLILQQGKRALHARLASSHRREEQAVGSAHLVEMKAEPAALPAPGGRSPEKLSSKRKPNRLMIEVDTPIGPQKRIPRRMRAPADE